MRKIIGVTIGPIVKTILSANDTGQLWGSSYIFSYLMKTLIKKFDSSEIMDEQILPAKLDENYQIKRVGIYPDRLIFTNNTCDGRLLKEKIDKNIDEVVLDIATKFSDNNTKKIFKFLKDYFQINYAIINENAVENIIIDMNEILDSLELDYRVLPKEKINYLMKELSNEVVKKGFLAADANILNEEIQSTEYIAKIHDSKSKYYAIVQSDGDNIGNIIKKIGKDLERLKVFSNSLNEYIIKAIKVLDDYKAYTLYAGGDDLLFFAPLKSRDMKKELTIYDLLDNLNKVFKETMKKEFPEEEVSMSFGLSITYHKYPLYEGLSLAQGLLFGDAKHFEFNNLKKNAIATQIVKHSGQSSKVILNQSSETYRTFKNLLLETQNDRNNKAEIKSIKNSFREGNVVLKTLVDQKRPIKSYFKNNYNKDVHIKFEDYINNISSLINTYREEKGKFDLSEIYNVLEIKDFISKGGNNEI